MTEVNRQLLWLQGNVLTDEALKSLGLQKAEQSYEIFAVVISHDCDLTAALDKEPIAEVIVGRRIEKMGGDSFGKTARRLHIEYQSESGPVYIELVANCKKPINKTDLFAHQPRTDIKLSVRDLRILQRWLAARYARAAFPEAFETRLRAAIVPGKYDLVKKIEKILDVGGDHIRALLFDMDKGENVERKTPDDLYRLGIMVLYDSLRDEPAAFAAATDTAEALEGIFEAAFKAPTGAWQNVELEYCDLISDTAMTVAMSESLKQWRLEYLSLQDEPPAPTLDQY
jgi:hypothetical protein